MSIKLTLSSYSFSGYKGKKKVNMLTAIPLAKKLGFNAVELVDDNKKPYFMKKADAKKIAQKAAEYGLEISSYTFSADLLRGSGGNIDKEIKRVCKQISLAKIMGAKQVRHDIINNVNEGQSYDSVLPQLIKGAKAITEFGAMQNIKTSCENHGFYFQDMEKIRALIEGVNNPNFHLLADIGNFYCGDINAEEAFTKLAPFIGYVHAKDFIIKTKLNDNDKGYFKSRGGKFLKGATIGTGNVPVKECIKILTQHKYNGYICIEYEGTEDPIQGILTSKRYILNCLNK